MSSFNLAAFREDLSRRRPAAFEATSTISLAHLMSTPTHPHVALDLGNAEFLAHRLD